MQNGCIEVLFGDGKGKTTSALGQALRAAGQGLGVLMFQFLKQAPSGESLLNECGKLPFHIRRLVCPRGFYAQMDDADRKETARAVLKGFLEAEEAILSERYDVVVLDEIFAVLEIGILKKEKLLSLMQKKPKSVELILTGRLAPKEVLAMADYVSEIKEHKHPYRKGLSARRGIEF